MADGLFQPRGIMFRFYIKQIVLGVLDFKIKGTLALCKNIRSGIRKKNRFYLGCSTSLSNFEGYNFVGPNSKIYNSKIGLFSYISYSSHILNTEIGRFCSIGMNTIIGPGKHPTTYISTHPFFYSSKNEANNFNTHDSGFDELPKVKIGHDVWIGANVIIMNGISIGNGCIIGAGSIVTKDLPEFSIAMGIPAEIKKYRFSKEEAVEITASVWWEWPLEELRVLTPCFWDRKHFFAKLRGRNARPISK
jgi:acetyltransferase-like isoleucine patch superfamily enzyme